MERALAAEFSAEAIASTETSAADMISDIHGSAAYRAQRGVSRWSARPEKDRRFRTEIAAAAAEHL
jgi:hypothetical protein